MKLKLLNIIMVILEWDIFQDKKLYFNYGIFYQTK